ncbi:MAG: glycoside hydrolase, partial [Alteromonadales bacterium]|nr:glycoside hydrolase [Alteromonadales bacterium]
MFNLSKIAKSVALASMVSMSAHATVDEFKSVGYFPSWSGNAQDIQYDKLTHINYSFLLLNQNGSLQPIASPQKLKSLVNLSHAAGVKVGIAIGGWNGSRNNEFENMSATSAGRTQFVKDVMAFVAQYDLDGVDMDWEYPDSGQVADNFALLMDELSVELHGQDKFLTAAVAASGWGARGVKAEVFEDIDFLNLMAYDADHSAGQHHSTYEFAEQSIDFWQAKGLSKEKTVLGVPFYSQPARTYRDIVASEAGAACKDVTNSGAGYNGIPTIQKKTQLALEKAGGIMNWELSQDTHDETSLLTAIDQVINGETSSVCDPIDGGT